MTLSSNDFEWLKLKYSQINQSDIEELGFFGNIWVRSHTFKKAGHTNGGGHFHVFDHVTLLIKGSIKVEVEGYEPTRYIAPTFIIIKKDEKHKITALEDDTVYYCVFAMRDINGDITDVYSQDNSPYNAIGTKEAYESFQNEYKNRKKILEDNTILKD